MTQEQLSKGAEINSRISVINLELQGLKSGSAVVTVGAHRYEIEDKEWAAQITAKIVDSLQAEKDKLIKEFESL